LGKLGPRPLRLGRVRPLGTRPSPTCVTTKSVRSRSNRVVPNNFGDATTAPYGDDVADPRNTHLLTGVTIQNLVTLGQMGVGMGFQNFGDAGIPPL